VKMQIGKNSDLQQDLSSADVVSILADHDVADVVVDAEDIPEIADKHSVETLCQVWRQSRSDQLPHICSRIENIPVIHINNGESEDWI